MRHYVAVWAGIGLQLGAVLTEEHIRDALLALHPSGGRPRGDTWSQCVAQREAIERWPRERARGDQTRSTSWSLQGKVLLLDRRGFFRSLDA